MKYTFDHDLHIHTHLSLCSECPEQTTERILRYAKEEGLREVCVTDHYWDRAVYRAPDWYHEQDFAHIAQNLPLPQADGVRFSFGCETEMDVNGVLGIPQSRFDDFDFIIVPTTHLHMGTFVVPLEECETFDLETKLTISLKKGSDGKEHYAVIYPTLLLYKNGASYSKNVATLKEKKALATQNIQEVVQKYTATELKNNPDAIRQEALKELQEIFGKDLIVQVVFGTTTIQ
jgi:flagellar FliL protein